MVEQKWTFLQKMDPFHPKKPIYLKLFILLQSTISLQRGQCSRNWKIKWSFDMLNKMCCFSEEEEGQQFGLPDCVINL